MVIIHSSRSPDIKLGEIQLTKSLPADEGGQTIPLLYKNSREAFVKWENTSTKERISYIQKFLQIYISNKQKIAESISLEIGKPISQSIADIDYDIGYIQWFIDNAENILANEVLYEDAQSKHIANYDAIGVMAVISPRNYPTSQRVREVIPTLIAGNTVIYKCSSSCIRTANILNQILESVLPKNVFAYIYGSGDMGDELVKGDCDGVIFTGSTKVGQHISEVSSMGMKKTFLELGGSAPAIITESANIDDNMMQTFDYFRRRHGGQICDGIKRVIIHRNKYEEFMKKMSDYLQKKKIGNPMDTTTDIGPLVSDRQLQTLQSQIDDAISKGAIIHQFGNYDNTAGPFILPTLITGVNLDMLVMTEETFGPILPVYIYDNIDEAISVANSSAYGLGGYMWSDNSDDINKITNGINTGNISVNNASYLIPQVPFGGYTTSSGNTRAHGKIGLRELCKIKIISISK